ncbi:MAG: L-2-hydroxyglutarate oxidase [Planctomyces sp.]|nr:L-2-hydroxyglutarate oxidase [Planctomyces sp.]
MSRTDDVIIVGGGIVGLATAYQLLLTRPETKLRLIEKESQLAMHQTGHNSGVIHSGIYYKPGSLRATNCRAGKQLLEEFCTAEQIPFDRCGKVIVATSEAELPALANIFERGQANGVECRRIGPEELAEREPHCAGIAAIEVPEAGIVDYTQVSLRLADKIREMGGEIECGVQLQSARQESNHNVLLTSQGDRTARLVVTCAGLQSDRVAKLCGWKPKARIIPFRGEYYELKPKAHHLCRHLIYPVPDPRFPFLGVHFTRMITGGVECGPNAVLAFAREGYRKTDFSIRDLYDAFSFAGFRQLGLKHWAMGAGEMWRSVSKAAFTKALQKLIPEIRSQDLTAAPAGIRAQAVSPDGSLVDDFLIEADDRWVHVLNAPSPAATASLQIGKTILESILPRL